MSEMKTIHEWLQQLPLGYRGRAISQSNCLKCEQPSMIDALLGFAYWLDTEEGHGFWIGVYNHFNDGTPLPPLPDDTPRTDTTPTHQVTLTVKVGVEVDGSESDIKAYAEEVVESVLNQASVVHSVDLVSDSTQKDLALFIAFYFWSGYNKQSLFQEYDEVYAMAQEFVSTYSQDETWEDRSFEEAMESFIKNYKQ